MRKTCLAAFALAVGCASPVQAQDADLVALLRYKDQALLNAIPFGDGAVYERELAPEFVYVAEDGKVVDRAGLLRALASQKPPYDGSHFQITDYALHVIGDTAVAVFHADEVGTYHGSKLTGVYLTSEMWQRLGGDWKLCCVHIAAVPTSPPAVALTAAQLDEVVGTYDAASLTYTVRREGSRLLAKASDDEEKEWQPETRDTFFQSDRPRQRIVLRRDPAGKVTGFSWRNENRSVVFARVN